MIARSLVCFLISLLLTGLAFGAGEESTAVEPEGDAAISIAGSKLSIDVRIRTRRVQAGISESDNASLLAKDCPEGQGPCSLVEDVSIAVNKVPLFVPRSAFRGLFNVRVAKLAVGSRAFQLVLRGGDASEGYFATLVFDKSRVSARRIASSLAPRDVLEETVYRQQKESFDR